MITCKVNLTYHSSQYFKYLYCYYFLYSRGDVQVSLRTPRLIPTGSEINDQVNLQ